MKLFRERGRENRRSLDELGPGLRDRVLALDEPVSREDWAGVVRRSYGVRFSERVRTGIVLSAALAAVVAVGSVLGLRISIAGGSGGGHAGPALAAFRSAVADRTLSISPSKRDGFCYEWMGEARGCESKMAPLGASWRKGRVIGAFSSTYVSSVTIRFADGTSAKPDISWISAPVNAGFFLYKIPAGKKVVAVSGSLNAAARRV
jgi:hypothetical protein